MITFQHVVQDVQTLPMWVEYVKALGTPVVALVAALAAGAIAYRQWRTAHNKLKLDFFDKRMEIYNCALELIYLVAYPLPIDPEEVIKLAKGLDGAQWLLNPRVAKDLRALAQRCYDHSVAEDGSSISKVSRSHRLSAAKRALELEKQAMRIELDELDKLFEPFLSVTH